MEKTELLWWSLEIVLRESPAVMIETHFNGERSPVRIRQIADKYSADILLVHLNCEVNERIDRCIKRVKEGRRHPGHQDVTDKVKLTVGKLLPDHLTPDLSKRPPMDLGGQLIEIDTTDFDAVDFIGIESQLRDFLQAHR